MILGLTFGMKQYTIVNYDQIVKELHNRIPITKKYKLLENFGVCTIFSWPLGFATNYIGGGTLVYGTFTATLFIAMIHAIFVVKSKSDILRS